MKITHFSIKRPIFTLVTMALVIILGVVSFTRVPLQLIPNITPPVGVVVSTYPGAGSLEVLDKVTKPLEENLATVPGLKTIISSTQEGANLIFLEFSWKTDIDEIQSDVQQRIDQTPIPEDAGKPRFLKFDPTQVPVILLSLRGEGDGEVLHRLAEEMKTELSRVDGIASVTVSGSFIQDMVVSLKQEKLAQYGLTQNDIVNVLAANEISLPGAPIETDGRHLTTRILSTLDSADEIKELVIQRDPLSGVPITIGDVASVELKTAEADSITRTNESPSVLLSVLQKSDADTVEVSGNFQNLLNDLLKEEKYSPIQADVLFDQGDYIVIVLNNILQSLIIGGLLAIVVLFLFLREMKSPIIIAISMPYSVIVTFVLLFLADFSLNMMTLGGLALSIGMLVDNSIVVIENIQRHLSMGKAVKKACREGTKEVASAIIASTLTTIAVFIPVIFIEGFVGNMFKEFALTVAFSLFASLWVALTVVPMMASLLLKPVGENREILRQQSPFYRGLGRAVRWSLSHRFFLLTCTLFLSVLSIWGLTRVGTQFLPQTDEGYFSINVELENGAALSETDRVVANIEQILNREEEVEVVVSLIGSTQSMAARGSSAMNEAQIFVKLKDLGEREESVFDLSERLLPLVEKAAEQANPTAKVEFQLQAFTGLEPNVLSFQVADSDKNRLEQSVREIREALRSLDGVLAISTDLEETVDEIRIEVKRETALSHGLVPAQIAMIVNEATRGAQPFSIIDESGTLRNVRVEFDGNVKDTIEGLKRLLIRKPDGTFVELQELADLSIGESPVNIQRRDQLDAVEIRLSYSTDTTLGEISSRVAERLENLNLPESTEIFYTGEMEMLESTMGDMVLAFILAVVFVYIVMAAQFESLKYPFVILFTVPLMFIGVALALALTGTPVSIMAIIGLIILAGIVVNNGIVIVDYINRLKEYGMDSREALIQAVKDRFRPVMMTALTTILGLIPLALGLGEGSEMTRPLGISAIGGLTVSTFLTLFLIPVVYSFFDQKTRRMNGKRKEETIMAQGK
jgi:AcrB/AcrD/AcrF family.